MSIWSSCSFFPLQNVKETVSTISKSRSLFIKQQILPFFLYTSLHGRCRKSDLRRQKYHDLF